MWGVRPAPDYTHCYIDLGNRRFRVAAVSGRVWLGSLHEPAVAVLDL